MLKNQIIDDAVNRFIVGDCKEVMERLPTESIDLVLTSPPYADKRDYGTKDASIAPDDYVDWFIPKAQRLLYSTSSVMHCLENLQLYKLARS